MEREERADGMLVSKSDDMLYPKVAEAAAFIRESLSTLPTVGIVLGSGLGGIADQIASPVYLPYAGIPHMPRCTAPTHKGRFVCGKLGGHDVICMQGRIHPYEGYTARDIAFPIFVMRALGVETLLLTNSSGGINTTYDIGDIMVVTDHINLTGKSPLIGPEEPALGPRFNDMSEAYSRRLNELLDQAARQSGIPVQHGVYLGDLGPQFETPAEIRAYRTLGADVVGMSTVLEVIAAANCGIETCALSLVTNMAAGVLPSPILAEDVERIGQRRSAQMCSLVKRFVELL